MQVRAFERYISLINDHIIYILSTDDSFGGPTEMT